MSSPAAAPATKVDIGPVPLDYLPGLKQNAKFDIVAGFILFLIALPLSLAIALASGVPAVAGVLTAMVGGMIGGMLGGSYVTINGPAAGLIVIVLGAVAELGALNPGDPLAGYKYMLAVGVAMGVIQIILGLIKAGPMTNVFPFSVVEGMVAGIGIIIMAKQIHVVLGVKATGSMLAVIAAIPSSFANMAPHAAALGAIAMAIMIIWPKFPKLAKIIPAPLAIMMITIPLAASFGMDADGKPLVKLVSVPLNFVDSFAFPDFSKILDPISIKYILTFVIVGSLESLLTASAIEKKDPWKRRNNMNREFWSKGVANSVSCGIGGIPMIAEVVRSSTNVMVGARTRWSNFFHGFFMLAFVAGLPWLLNMIPLSALAGMLVVIGFRLAHPKIFAHIAHTGTDELIFMVGTVIGVVLVDLLVGVFFGMWLSIGLNAIRAGSQNKFGSAGLFLAVHIGFLAGVAYFHWVAHNELFSIACMMVSVVVGIMGFKTVYEVKASGDTVTVSFSGPAVYTSLIGVRSMMDKLPGGKKVVFDFSKAGLVDHTVREKINDFSEEYARETRGTVTVTGLEQHTPTAHHDLSSMIRVIDKSWATDKK